MQKAYPKHLVVYETIRALVYTVWLLVVFGFFFGGGGGVVCFF